MQESMIAGPGSLQDFQIISKLGEGSFSMVYKVQRISDGEEYAMKKVQMGMLKEKERENALNEVRILASLADQYIVGYKDAFIDEASSTLCVVMEYASGGDLQKQINDHIKNKTSFDEKEVWQALVNMSQGLQSLHEMKILHRDLKCANVFLSAQGVFQLGDLNVSKVAQKGLVYTQTGTPYYASPEVWRDEPYDMSSDIWSLGCVLYEMAALQPPFRAQDMQGLYKKVQKGAFDRIPNQYSNELQTVIAACLKVTPSQRPSSTNLLDNPIVIRNSGQSSVQPIRKNEKAELLNTIKLPQNLGLLKGKLPKANYKQQKSLLTADDSEIAQDRKQDDIQAQINNAPNMKPTNTRSIVSAGVRRSQENIPSYMMQNIETRTPVVVSSQVLNNLPTSSSTTNANSRAPQAPIQRPPAPQSATNSNRPPVNSSNNNNNYGQNTNNSNSQQKQSIDNQYQRNSKQSSGAQIPSSDGKNIQRESNEKPYNVGRYSVDATDRSSNYGNQGSGSNSNNNVRNSIGSSNKQELPVGGSNSNSKPVLKSVDHSSYNSAQPTSSSGSRANPAPNYEGYRNLYENALGNVPQSTPNSNNVNVGRQFSNQQENHKPDIPASPYINKPPSGYTPHYQIPQQGPPKPVAPPTNNYSSNSNSNINGNKHEDLIQRVNSKEKNLIGNAYQPSSNNPLIQKNYSEQNTNYNRIQSAKPESLSNNNNLLNNYQNVKPSLNMPTKDQDYIGYGGQPYNPHQNNSNNNNSQRPISAMESQNNNNYSNNYNHGNNYNVAPSTSKTPAPKPNWWG